MIAPFPDRPTLAPDLGALPGPPIGLRAHSGVGPRSIARRKERNKAIPGYTPDEIEVRCERVDRSNATIVQKSSSRADMSVRSERSIDSPQAANA